MKEYLCNKLGGKCRGCDHCEPHPQNNNCPRQTCVGDNGDYINVECIPLSKSESVLFRMTGKVPWNE